MMFAKAGSEMQWHMLASHVPGPYASTGKKLKRKKLLHN
jgi:hypothetical protein